MMNEAASKWIGRSVPLLGNNRLGLNVASQRCDGWTGRVEINKSRNAQIRYPVPSEHWISRNWWCKCSAEDGDALLCLPMRGRPRLIEATALYTMTCPILSKRLQSPSSRSKPVRRLFWYLGFADCESSHQEEVALRRDAT